MGEEELRGRPAKFYKEIRKGKGSVFLNIRGGGRVLDEKWNEVNR